MRSVFVIFAAVILLVPGVLAQGHTVEIKLKLNNTSNYIYIPGMGEIASSEIGSEKEYSTPDHFYIASYLGNYLTGLVARKGKKLFYASNSQSHTIGIQQEMDNFRVFLPSTFGGYAKIENKISMIEVGKFLIEVSPSFAYPMAGFSYPVTMILSYNGINFLNDVFFKKGHTGMVIENIGIVEGNLTLEISET